ncbi:MAG TPA: Nif3-like dinuclear metal center hexameric protein [Lactobacillaceae bacterium]|jgi:dinuclear metal center YbgI/SA1388 family protein
MIAQDLIDLIEGFAPVNLAEKGDPTGLQIGNPNREIDRVMTTLDVRPEVVAEAINNQVDFIWAHHEAMFFPAKNLDLRDPQNQMYADLLKHNIVVYASHTNLDAAQGGMNDWLAAKLGLRDIQPLLPNDDGVTGLGRIGSLKEAITVADYAAQLRDTFKVKTLRVIAPDTQRPVQKIAVIGGDGGKYWRTAQQAGADVLVTADVYYHVGHDIISNDFVVIDPDHHMEAVASDKMAEKVWQWSVAQGWDLSYIGATHANTDPYTYI